MLFVKLLCLFAGGGILTGLSVSNAYKGKPQISVANNKTAKKLAKMELKLTHNLLKMQKTNLDKRKKTSDEKLVNKTSQLETAKQDLIKANLNLNTEKTTLNTHLKTLNDSYVDLKTKNDALKDALETKMKWELEKNEKTLKKAFYTAQKDAYTKEKEAIKTKIDAIGPASTTDICSSYTFTISPAAGSVKTTEEEKIETEIKEELKKVCDGLTASAEGIQTNSTVTTDTSDYTAKKTARDAVVKQISETTQKYNLQIQTIRTAEFEVTSKKMHWTQKKDSHKLVKEKSEQVNNQLSVLGEKIEGNNDSWSSF